MSSRTSLQNSPSDFGDNILKKSIKSEKAFSNNDKTVLTNEKRDTVPTSSYKFLSWREKDRRRRFRDEWKHMWLVIPHGNFEVMCLVCHKVMTQRKLDTIKRHTVRRHTEILDMDQGERIILFEKLFLEHDSLKFQQKATNNNHLSDTKAESEKPDSDGIDLEKLLSSDCVSATSSSSLSPSELQHKNNSELKFFSKRGKYPRKNIKINIKSGQKIDSVKTFSLKSTFENQSVVNKNVVKSNNVKAPHIVDNKLFNLWANATSADRLLPPGNNNPVQDSFYGKFNGSSCLNFHQPMPVMNKCPLCLEDCSPNGTDSNNAFSRLMSHIQQKHSDKFPPSIPSFDHHQFGSTSADEALKLQSLLLPPTTNTNYMSISNAISNANLISLLYYQELLRQNVPTNQSPSQYGSVSSDSMYYQSTTPSSNSSIFPLFSSPSPQCSLRPSSLMPPAFILPTLSESVRPDRSDPISNHYEDTSSCSFDKFSPCKRVKFSAESLISEANKQSAFYNPKSGRIEEKDINCNLVTKMPSILATYSTANEPSKTRCKEHRQIKEENNTIEAPHIDKDLSQQKSDSDPHTEQSLSPKSSAQGNLTCHALRFGPGQELKVGLQEYIRRKKISAAFVMTCCGSLSHAKLRMANSGIPNTALEIKNLNKHFEIVSLVGSIFDHGCHLHISLSDSNGDVIGGHVIGDLIVHTTAEVMIGQICGVRMRHEFDESTGYPEMSFTSLDVL